MAPARCSLRRAHFPPRPTRTRFLAVVEADIARGLYIDPTAGRVTFAEWSDRWLARPGKREASTARDRQALASFRAHLGSVLLVGLTPGLIQEVVELRSTVAAPATVARDFSAPRASLNAAVNADLIARSPARNIALPRVVHSERTELSPPQLVSLVQELPGHYRALVLVGAVLGLRWGEAVGLRVRDVDFMRQTVTIAQTVEELSGHMRIVPEAKTRSSLRTLAVPNFLMDELTRHLQEYRPDVIGRHVDLDAVDLHQTALAEYCAVALASAFFSQQGSGRAFRRVSRSTLFGTARSPRWQTPECRTTSPRQEPGTARRG